MKFYKLKQKGAKRFPKEEDLRKTNKAKIPEAKEGEKVSMKN